MFRSFRLLNPIALDLLLLDISTQFEQLWIRLQTIEAHKAGRSFREPWKRLTPRRH